MARLAFNKSTLSKQMTQLKSYKEYLPSLDLKRRQLVTEQAKARDNLAELERQTIDIVPIVEEHLPMLSNTDIDVTDLVVITDVNYEKENIVGTWLPTVASVDMKVRDYSLLGSPHWVDRLVSLLKSALQKEIEIQIARERLKLLEKSVRTITQRVNLFDKVLIPQSQSNIKKIRIFLSDLERAAVVRSKIAKAKKVSVE